MTGASPVAPEERLRTFLVTEAEQAMAATDTQAELRRFHDSVRRSRTARRRTWLAGVAAAAVAVTAVTVTGDLLRSRGEQPVQVAGSLDEPAALPRSVVQDELAMSGDLGTAAYPAAGALWRLATERSVDRIDPASATATRVPLGVTAYGPFTEADGLVWFPGRDGPRDRLFALDPATNDVVRRTEPLPTARSVGSGPAGLWAVTGLRELTQIDPATGAILRTVQTQNGVYDVHVGDGVVYAGAYQFGTGITVLDTTTGATRTVLPAVAPGPLALTEDGGLWVHDSARGALVRYDATSFREEAAIELGLPTAPGAQRDFIWVDQKHRRPTTVHSLNIDVAHPVVVGSSLYAAYNLDTTARLLRADVRTGDITAVIDFAPGGDLGPLTAADGSLWVAWGRSDTVRRLALFE